MELPGSKSAKGLTVEVWENGESASDVEAVREGNLYKEEGEVMDTTAQTISGQGVYTMSLSEYVADPAPAPSLNTSTAMALLTQSPLHAKMQHPRLNPSVMRDKSSRADLGTIAHLLLLEADIDQGIESMRVTVVHAEDWRTKAAKDLRDQARAEGKTPILEKDYVQVLEMVKAAQIFLLGSDICTDWLAAAPEQTLIWKESSGIWCRSRPDKLSKDGKVYLDYKTTGSAHPSAFVKTAISQGYDIQAALGARGIKVLRDVECEVIFVVQEIDPPYVCSLVSLSPMFRAIANERLELALEQWRRCLTTQNWAGYPARVATVDPPGWYGHDQLEGL